MARLSPSRSQRSALCDTSTCTPSACSAWRASSETSGSSRIMMRGAISTCCTRAPSRASACDNSQPIGPPPSTTMRRGISSSSAKLSHRVSLVT